MDEKKLYQIASDLLHRLVEYWDGLSQERKSRYFDEHDAEVISEELIGGASVGLRITRYDYSIPVHVHALVSCEGVVVRMLAFRLTTGELKWSEENVALLVEIYQEIYKELQHELA